MAEPDCFHRPRPVPWPAGHSSLLFSPTLLCKVWGSPYSLNPAAEQVVQACPWRAPHIPGRSEQFPDVHGTQYGTIRANFKNIDKIIEMANFFMLSFYVVNFYM